MAHQLKVRGQKPLVGEAEVSGAKNSITKLLVASMLSRKRSFFSNVPNICEVELTLELCQAIGMQARWDKLCGTIECITPEILTSTIPSHFAKTNRIPILLLGILVGQTRSPVVVPGIGGCNLGHRPVDFHLHALKSLGAQVSFISDENNCSYIAVAPDGLKASVIELSYPSVGATENAIFAAVHAKGTTLIKNCALEPELFDLILFLQKMGVNINLGTNRSLFIEGTTHFEETEHRVIFDRIEAASLAMAALATGGHVFIRGATQPPLIPFLNKIRQMGASFYVEDAGIRFFAKSPLRGDLYVETDTHPGFLTDWQPPFATLLTQCDGTSIIHETVFDNRFGYVPNLVEMGANLTLSTHCLGAPCRFVHAKHNHSLLIKGKTPLKAAHMAIPDLRAGFAYVMAALIAEGESSISNLHFLDRGYEAIDQKLAALGADIRRETLIEVGAL